MLKLLTHPNPHLSKDLTGIASKASHIKEHHKELFRLCTKYEGIGISASQVGLNENFFFIMPNAHLYKGKKVAHICINPKWAPADKAKKVPCNEGCLSLPGRDFRVERWTEIVASWDTAVGHRLSDVKLKGFAAQVFQHEADHLRGVTLLRSGEENL